MKIFNVVAICCTGVLLLFMGPASFAATTADDIVTITVAANPPLAANQFLSPTFTPASLGAQSSSSFDQGNWHYTIHYRYDNQGWEVKEYEAQRIHASGQMSIVKQVARPMAGCGGGSAQAIGSSSFGVQPSGCGPVGNGAPPDPSDLPSPSISINSPPHAGDTASNTWSNYEGSGWTVVAKWTWVIEKDGTGQWELTYVLETQEV